MSGNLFRKQGAGWLIAHDGKATNIGDLTGANYIACLLHHQGREISASALRSTTSTIIITEPMPTGDDGLTTKCSLGDNGEILDEQAKTEYKKRIVELSEICEGAKSRGDFDAAIEAENESEDLKKQLALAFGLGGKIRKAGDSAKKDYDAVAKAVRETIEKIKPHHLELANHFRRYIRLGNFCIYDPPQYYEWTM